MTRAIRYLKEQGIAFEVAEYDHLHKGALFASQALGIPVERTIKTLVVEVSKKGYLVVLMPGSKSISFKKLAKIRGVKRAAMVNTAMAERLTGYLVGGISPFGMKQRLPVVIDAGLLAFDKVAINGGKRGVMLIMAPLDIIMTTGAEDIEL
ncbi:MAG: aminoacyl-tRNA deacylase [Deltaproteobacteria bacterium]|nr:aminoacyl-tRNA deacylase [Deltaproteobacteria bacterium]